MRQKTYFDCVNLIKLILAIAIVAMHCALVPDHSLPMVLLCRLGVPYFFVASGFFLQRKCIEDQTGNAVKSYTNGCSCPMPFFLLFGSYSC